MSFTGNLSSVPLEDVLGWLSTQELSGLLVIDGASCSKMLYVDKRHITATSSTNPREFLSAFLVGWGILDDAQLEQLFEMQGYYGSLIGELLVSQGHLSARQLERILTTAAQEVVFDAFTWTSGSYRYLDGVVPTRRFHPLRLPLDRLIAEGIARREAWQQISQVIPSPRYRPRSQAVSDVASLTADDITMLLELDGTKSVEQLAHSRRVTTFAMLEQLAPAVRRGALELLPPQSESARARTFRAQLLQAEESLVGGHLLAAWETVEQLARRPAVAREIEPLLQSIRRRIDESAQQSGLSPEAVPVLAIPNQDLATLECSSHEGLVLSCVDGRASVAAILDELPGDAKRNRLLLIDLVDRGLLALKATS